MVSINPENVKNIVQSAENGLKKKALGGFTPESTKEALQKVADGVKQLADNAIGAVQRELQMYKGKSAQEMAELTSKKDAVILGKDKQIQEAAEKLADAKQQIKTAKSVKTGKPKTLPNGNIETVKVNKNGARMTTETTPDGRKVNVSVETLDGDIRKTKYDPVSGKPVKTFTNINGDKTIEYGEYESKIKDVNVKKSKTKPTVVNRVQEVDNRTGERVIRQTYSDGSYKIAHPKNNYGAVQVESFSPSQKLTKRVTTWDEAQRIEKFGDKTYTCTDKNSHFTTTQVQKYDSTGKSYVASLKTVRKDGSIEKFKRDVDEFGIVKPEYTEFKYFPKNSKVAYSHRDVKVDGQYSKKNNRETYVMKDGSKYIVNYQPSSYDTSLIVNQGKQVALEYQPKDAEKSLKVDDTLKMKEFFSHVGMLK